jgi:hypothetical protein
MAACHGTVSQGGATTGTGGHGGTGGAGGTGGNATCEGEPQGAPCATSSECVCGLYCDATETCTACAGKGEACTTDDGCCLDSGSVCTAGQCT